MSQICPCGRRATHRLLWNEWLDTTEPVPSKRPSRCLECAIRDARLDTEARRQRFEYEQNFPHLDRLVFCTVTQVPHEWVKLARQAARRHPEVINPGGLVKVFQQNCVLYVELYPPRERPDTWQAEHCLFILRYLTRRPLVFRPVERNSGPSPATRRESREQWSATLPAPLAPLPTDTEPS